MKRLVSLAVAALCILGVPLLAQSPDDQFIRIYNLIQQGDLAQGNGQPRAAQEKYRAAQELLQKLEQDFPQWNPKIIKYRKNYVAERLGPVAAPSTPEVAPLTNAAPGGPSTAPPVAPAQAGPDPRDERIAQLSQEINALRTDRETLQAKLREALSVQPTPVDPRELAAAENRVKELSGENLRLRTDVAQLEEKVAKAADPAALAQANAQLADATARLARQDQELKSLSKERTALQERLKRKEPKTSPPASNDRALAEAQRALKDAKASLSKQDVTIARLANEKSALETRVQRLTAEAQSQSKQPDPTLTASLASANAQVTELRTLLDRAQKELREQQSRGEVLVSEKATLERRLAELSSRPPRAAAAPPASAATPAAANPAVLKADKDTIQRLEHERDELKAKVAELTRELEKNPQPAASAPTPAAVPDEKTVRAETKELKRLEKERNDLQQKVARLNRELEQRKDKRGTAQPGATEEQLAIARARLRAYEATPAPYTAEEMALFKQTPQVAVVLTNRPGSKAARELAPAATQLVIEAQRAFQNQDLAAAEQKYVEALKIDERNPSLLTDLAATQIQRDRLDEAEATLKRALAADSENATALSLRGLLRFKQGRYDDAVDSLSRAAQIDPDNPQTQNYLGIALSQKGLRKPAEAALRKAISLQPGYGEAHNNLAVVYATQKPPFLELARWHYQRALASGHPKNPELEKLLQAAGSK